MNRRDFAPHGPGCPCEAWVEVMRGAEGLPCPAMWDAYRCGEPNGEWRVAHRVERSASKGVKVWSWWERAPAPSTKGGAPRPAEEACPECGGTKWFSPTPSHRHGWPCYACGGSGRKGDK